MDEQTRGFRSAIFGGFNREDVMHYIEETDTKYYTETAELRSQLTEAQSAMNELRTQNEALTAKNAELLERLGEMTLDTDKIRAQLDQIESGFSLQATEIEAQNARAAQLAAENAKLSAKCGEYDATREKIAEMELSAYRRAKQIEEDAKVELQKLRRKSMETIEQVRRQLDATKENYRTVLARNQQESAEMARKAGEVLGEIDKISASLGKKDGEAPHPEPDKAKNGLREVLNNLRPKTEE